jgi:hypothetical protein
LAITHAWNCADAVGTTAVKKQAQPTSHNRTLQSCPLWSAILVMVPLLDAQRSSVVQVDIQIFDSIHRKPFAPFASLSTKRR